MTKDDDIAWFRDNEASAKVKGATPKKPPPATPTPIAPGDVVKLPSGGPAMTVIEIATGTAVVPASARCVWMTDAGLGGPLGIPLFALVKVEAPHG